MNWYLDVLKKYAVFTGRARRQEYWMFFLIYTIIYFLLLFSDMNMNGRRLCHPSQNTINRFFINRA